MSIELASARATASADEKLMDNLRSELLIAKEMLKSIANSLAALGGRESSLLKKYVEEVTDSKKRVELMQRDFLTYFSKVAPSLYNREEWIGMFSKISGIIDKISGVAYRTEYLSMKSWNIPADIRGKLMEMVELLTSMLDEYIAMMNYALVNTSKALESRSKIAAAEAEMDSRYRAATFAVLEASSLGLLALMLHDIAEMLEDVADLLNSASDDLYLITLSSSS